MHKKQRKGDSCDSLVLQWVGDYVKQSNVLKIKIFFLPKACSDSDDVFNRLVSEQKVEYR